ncbi:hypothetical protein GGTG_05588 [Gaeumannomyces tritici R3-111a-1]|uniref:Uncharacterized protein n=1 Tax=Gaeumannomyces tritici (strain R3-111a-1) TaxID=644352 RepID=J3NWC4_GAET3|nr:hypothetical protein GGTG_05588 [Gaeumannomyces tritici R3-111a-1]EJT75656.1 hypothetical protein GGTG_05588 [Gaeumannomyces tritici R3-111a-1]
MSLLKRLLLAASLAATATLASPLAGGVVRQVARQGLEKRQQCGLTVCAAGYKCCNPLCSMCTKPGVVCTQQDCGHLRSSYSPGLPPRPFITTPAAATETVTTVPTFQTTLAPLPFPGGGGGGGGGGESPVTCGKNKCGKGQYCCNSSCGICAPVDGACIQLFCAAGTLPSSG